MLSLRPSEKHLPRMAPMIDCADSRSFFSSSFSLLNNGNAPYPWQVELFLRFIDSHIPSSCAIPTGLGKTSVITIWVLALAWQARNGDHKSIGLPRRLVYIVNRRTVVDQATSIAEALSESLYSPGSGLGPVAEPLDLLATRPSSSTGESPLVVSTLRGKLADNEAWKKDPARPSIIIGTVDMVGSRLLFSGYGDGRWKRSFHAGLLGTDTLFVHDEAHLSRPFGSLLRGVKALREKQARRNLKTFSVMEMTATPAEAAGDSILLSDDDRSLPVVERRLKAEKLLSISTLKKGENLAEILAGKALSRPQVGLKVLIYVKSPDLARKVANILGRSISLERVRVLTGTMRGYERDRLMEDIVFGRFISGYERSIDFETCYLVSTSAGEVGADFDADAGVLDLVPLDAEIQRIGRINRTGGRSASIDLVIDPEILKGDKLAGLEMTINMLKALPRRGSAYLASPESLSSLTFHEMYPEAITPVGRERKLEAYLLDTWSATGLDEPPGHPVAPWLHGIADEVPEVWMVWRRWLPTSENDLQRWMEAYPIVPREQARIPASVARGYIENLALNCRDAGIPVVKVAEVHPNGQCSSTQLDSLKITAFSTIIIPSEIGGLSKSGLPDPDTVGSPVVDVSGEEGVRDAWLIYRSDSIWNAEATNPDRHHAEAITALGLMEVVSSIEATMGMKVIIVVPLADEEPAENDFSALVSMRTGKTIFSGDQDVSVSSGPMLLDRHLRQVTDAARDIATALGLPDDLLEAIVDAARCHDLGKNRMWWQLAIGNNGPEIYAKQFGRKTNWKISRGYRHEFGSLLESLGDPENKISNDLAAHLIAAHHGFARPLFPDRAYDNSRSLQANRKTASDTMLRFDRLQREYGWWGLAYLEAILKSADIMGSREMS